MHAQTTVKKFDTEQHKVIFPADAARLSPWWISRISTISIHQQQHKKELGIERDQARQNTCVLQNRGRGSVLKRKTRGTKGQGSQARLQELKKLRNRAVENICDCGHTGLREARQNNLG